VFCVWFDDLEIKHKGAITAQETHYDPFGRSVLATTYQMASVHLRFAKQNNTELKTEIGFWLGVLCVVWKSNTKELSLRRKRIMARGDWSWSE